MGSNGVIGGVHRAQGAQSRFATYYYDHTSGSSRLGSFLVFLLTWGYVYGIIYFNEANPYTLSILRYYVRQCYPRPRKEWHYA